MGMDFSAHKAVLLPARATRTARPDAPTTLMIAVQPLRLSWYPMGGVRIYQPFVSLAKAFENCILLSLSAEGAVLLLTIVEEGAVGASRNRPVLGALGVRVRYDTRAYAELAARKARVTDMRD